MTKAQQATFDQLMNSLDRANNLANKLNQSVDPTNPFLSENDKARFDDMLRQVVREADRIKIAMGYEF